MKVILKQDVDNLGKTDDMVEVKDGYARNYLIPKGVAIEATAGNISSMKQRWKAKKLKAEHQREHAEEIAEKIRGLELKLKAKAGENGKLFGSITTMDIADALVNNHKLSIDKKKIVLEEPLKSLGEAVAEIKLHPGLSVPLKINVVEE